MSPAARSCSPPLRNAVSNIVGWDHLSLVATGILEASFARRGRGKSARGRDRGKTATVFFKPLPHLERECKRSPRGWGSCTAPRSMQSRRSARSRQLRGGQASRGERSRPWPLTCCMQRQPPSPCAGAREASTGCCRHGRQAVQSPLFRRPSLDFSSWRASCGVSVA
jgi:hypothetical protein